jgi:hypothetical protein
MTQVRGALASPVRQPDSVRLGESFAYGKAALPPCGQAKDAVKQKYK